MPLTPVTQILQNKVIPYAADDVQQRIIIAHPTMTKRHLPARIELERQKSMGKRLINKSRRMYGNARSTQATWPTPHLHETAHFKLICVAAGRAAYPVGDSLLHMSEGFFIFIPPGVPHPDGTTPHLVNNQGYCELLHLSLYSGAVQCWNCLSEDDYHSGDPHENFLVRESKTVNLLKALAEEVTVEEEGNPLIIKNLILAFFQMLLRDLLAGRYLQAGPILANEKSSSTQSEFTSTLHDYIRQNLHLPLTLETAAASMFLSRAQFARRVKAETGKTFIELLTQQRLENAKVLLRESDWTAAIIAELVGFKSVPYFNQLFTSHMGTTPGRYRQLANKTQAHK
jgi:AraC-like DNA-binding protein/mannose-6-phosphate isomerase-like protein (cupin superfamily)